MKNNKGITMISLVITIIVLIILTSATIYNGLAQLGIKRVNNLYADIDSISTKVAEYYLKNETIPIYNDPYVNNKDELKAIFTANGASDTEKLINVNDEGAYYVIDLSKLDNLTLNYGDDYKTWNSSEPKSQNVYIINTVTHQIYFPHGIRSGDNYYFARNHDDNTLDPVILDGLNTDLEVDITKLSRNNLENNKISIVADVFLNGNLNSFDLNSLEYAWSQTDNEANNANLSYTKFKLNNINEDSGDVKLSKNGINQNQEYIYLVIKVMDKNGDTRYIVSEQTKLPIVLPDDYQRVEYLESTGEQWIDTECIATSDNKFGVSMKVQLTKDRGKDVSTLALTGANESWNNGFSISQDIENPNKNTRASYGNTNNSEVRMNVDEIYNLSNIDGTFIINNNTYSINKSNTGFVSGSVLLFGLRRGNTVQKITLSSCKMYEAKVYTNDVIVRNFIPCYRKSDNVKGLYDLIGGGFYENLGDGDDFTAGNIVD